VARIAALLVALVSLLGAAAPAQAVDKPHPDQFLESGSITAGTPQGHPFTSTTKLIADHWYRIVLTGTWTLQYAAVGPQPAYEEEEDAAFCVRQTPRPDPTLPEDPPGRDCSRSNPPLSGALGNAGTSGGGGDFTPAGWLLSPTPNYTYEFTFKGRSTGDGLIRFWDGFLPYFGQSGYPSSDSGSYGFQLFGMKEDSTGAGAPATPPPTTAPTPDYTHPRVGAGSFSLPNPHLFTNNRLIVGVRCSAACTVTEGVAYGIGGQVYAGGAIQRSFRARRNAILRVKPPNATINALIGAVNAQQSFDITIALSVRSRGVTKKKIWQFSYGFG
jgi:hypothetical protein